MQEVLSDLTQLHINDLFHTFQGEGFHAGRRALFVRMPYCNLKCSWCDTSFNSYKKWTDGEFLSFAMQEKHRFAVITGGEPTMNKHTPRVIRLLKDSDYTLAIETNGCFPVPMGIDFITCSPKRDAKYLIHPDTYDKVHEFKYVIDKDFDFRTLDRHNVHDGRRYSLSPEFGNWNESLSMIFEFIKKNPHWRISLQTHKWMSIP